MKLFPLPAFMLAAVAFTVGPLSLHAQVYITEVDPSGSANAGYAADWFELTNLGPTAVNITGWKMDDNSNSFGSSVALNGISSIASGESVIFLETASLGTTKASFQTSWFGSVGAAPASLQFGSYSGSGVGLSQSGDAVNVFNSTGTVIARVDFGVAGTGTFDNAAHLNNVTLTQMSVAGVHGAFASPGGEIGSPAAIPEPGLYTLMAGLGALGFAALRRRLWWVG